ncbi:MAG: ribonuclease III [Deferribacteraceae bacterium]|jgi:ribonuclease III|nr:ribonuclease III [Deferribacteraceae bacterium]
MEEQLANGIPMNDLDLSILEDNLHYKFQNIEHLQKALIHSSYTHEHGLNSNERMEFYGDAILHFVLTEFLMQTYKDDNEGQLSALRSYCESEPFLYEHAIMLNLGSFIKFGKGEELSGGAFKESLLADAFEAIVAAVYQDGGYDAARDFILQLMRENILSAHSNKLHIDSKSELQKLTQKQYKALPEYEVVSESGLDHNKTFGVQVCVTAGERTLKATGYGRNKKAAEKDAARIILAEL